MKDGYTGYKYEMDCKEGDMIILPCGTPGFVKECKNIAGGNFKIVIITPITPWWHHLYLAVTGQLQFDSWNIGRLENLEPQLLAPSEG